MSRLTLGLLVLFCAAAQAQTAAPDTTQHAIRMIGVTGGVKLEVVDWGGSGPPLVFLSGLGATAHAFDGFAPEFTGKHHVYGITRRGFGVSDRPDPAAADYSADRLADDVLDILAELDLKNPVIAGHSIAGQEMSSIAARHPGKVAGLIYLDAGYAYAFYMPGGTVPLGDNLIIAASDLREKLSRFQAVPGQLDLLPLIADVERVLPQFEKDLAAARAEALLRGPLQLGPDTPQARIAFAVTNGERKHAGSHVRILALYAINPVPDDATPEARAAVARQNAAALLQADAFADANPAARVVRLKDASHGIWRSNRAAVLQEMNAFLDALPKR